MKIAILGAGFAGLAAAHELNKRGYEVDLFEKNTAAGGAAGGFKLPGWDWWADYAYHHWFTNEHEILKLCQSVGFNQILVRQPETSSLYQTTPEVWNHHLLYNYLFGPNTQIYKLDTPIDLLRFTRLNPIDRLRTGAVLAWLKFAPRFSSYDRTRALEWLKFTMGESATNVLWRPLFEKKFGCYFRDINMGFFWGRLRRTTKLSYPAGGYQHLANYLVRVLQKNGVRVHLQTQVRAIVLKKKCFRLKIGKQIQQFDQLISTLQTPLFLKLEKQVLPLPYRNALAKISYLGAQNIIIQSKEPILSTTYWLNIAAKAKTPVGLNWMGAMQHTNFMDKRHYANKHLFYLACYTNKLRDFTVPKHLFKRGDGIIRQTYIKYGQPLFTPEFTKVKPDYQSPVPGLYFANMELTYPFDRGTNHAVRVGKEAARRVI